MSGRAMTILGAVSASLAFLTGAQAAGTAGVEVVPPFAWLLLGAVNAGIVFVLGIRDGGTK